jgi:hypothetical protein
MFADLDLTLALIVTASNIEDCSVEVKLKERTDRNNSPPVNQQDRLNYLRDFEYYIRRNARGDVSPIADTATFWMSAADVPYNTSNVVWPS